MLNQATAKDTPTRPDLFETPRGLLGVAKVPTGVNGLDEILNGGLPMGRPTLLCGGAGCGKTLLSMEFLCRGASEHGEPGVFIAFEEKAEELAANVASLGFDLPRMEAEGLLVIDYVALDPQETVETGAYDLEGLFLRIASAVSSIGAKRIVIDTLEVLFGALQDAAVVRAELKRLFAWLKAQGLTAIITAERGDGERISRHGIEEYVSDCVILLDHRITEERSTRRLRVLKYRGSSHGADEYPFLISDSGFMVLPLSSPGPGAVCPHHQGLHRSRASGCHPVRRRLPGQLRPHQRHGRDGQDHLCRPLRRCRLPAGRKDSLHLL